jgi:hypothetical protein
MDILHAGPGKNRISITSEGFSDTLLLGSGEPVSVGFDCQNSGAEQGTEQPDFKNRIVRAVTDENADRHRPERLL